jgi:hypothetical protein
MESKRSARRPRGSGSIIVKSGAYYGKWWVGQNQVLRNLGPIRSPSSRDGLTGPMAEARLRQLMAEVKAPPVGERVTIEGLVGAIWRTSRRWAASRRRSVPTGTSSTLSSSHGSGIGRAQCSVASR